MVTVPGTLRRVVYIAPGASAGYRGCIPWWRRSHHPRSPSSQEEEKQQLSCFFFFSSLNSLPLQCDVSFFHSRTTTWADRIDFPLACGSISPLSLVLHTHTHTRTHHTHSCTHTYTLTAPLPSCFTCLPPTPSLSSFLLSFWRPATEIGFIRPSCLLSSCSLNIHEGWG